MRFPSIQVNFCICCKVTLSKSTLPKDNFKSNICKNCLSTSEGGVFFLTKEGEKFTQEENVQDQENQALKSFSS